MVNTRIENQFCLVMNKKKNINIKFAGMRNSALPRNVMNSIHLFLRGFTLACNRKKMPRSIRLYFFNGFLRIETRIMSTPANRVSDNKVCTTINQVIFQNVIME